MVVDEWWEPDEAAAGVVIERLGDGRTGSCPPDVERAITVDWWDYNLGAAYHTLKRVLEAVAGQSIQDLTTTWLTRPLGLEDTTWVPRRWDDRLPPRFRHSFEYPDGRPIEGLVTTARDLATFGRAVLEGVPGLDPSYGEAMVQPSQTLNPSYGLLWRLNGGPFVLPPKVATSVEGPFLPDVPPDAFAAMGANDRLCVVVPSLDLVIARCGASAGEPGAAGSRFGRQLVAAIVAALPA